MLHSALPRVFPGYLGNYFEDVLQPFVPYHHPQHYLDESYARLSEQRVLAWDTDHPRSAPTPCPLDLSLKTTTTDEPIEVDDEEDRRSREEIRSQHSYPRYASSSHQDTEEEVVVDDVDSQRSFSSGHSYPAPPEVAATMTTGYYEHQKHLLLSPVQSYQHHHQMQLLRTPPPPPPAPVGHHQPMTPPSTPSPPQQCSLKRKDTSSPQTTPKPPVKVPRAKKKHVRKLKFDEETSSPVSGTVILGPDEVAISGEIDKFNIVVVTEEARAKMAEIENRLGPYQCKLCKQLYDDAFQLAQHRCRRIANVEYRCAECKKLFNCPANLASHQRWHKVRPHPPGGEHASQEIVVKKIKKRPEPNNNNTQEIA